MTRALPNLHLSTLLFIIILAAGLVWLNFRVHLVGSFPSGGEVTGHG
jgi:hypothetical protein